MPKTKNLKLFFCLFFLGIISLSFGAKPAKAQDFQLPLSTFTDLIEGLETENETYFELLPKNYFTELIKPLTSTEKKPQEPEKSIEKKPEPTITPKIPQPKPLPASSLDQMFATYGQQHGVDSIFLKKIAYCESSFRPNAVNGIYAGLFQFTPATWSATRKKMGLDSNPDLRFNPEESIKTAAFKISQDGPAAWPVCRWQ